MLGAPRPTWERPCGVLYADLWAGRSVFSNRSTDRLPLMFVDLWLFAKRAEAEAGRRRQSARPKPAARRTSISTPRPAQQPASLPSITTDGGEASARYANKRAEMWGFMRKWCKVGCLPDDAELIADLGNVEYGYDASDALLLERKDDMRRRGLASPDDGDALALTFAHPVAKRDDRTERLLQEAIRRWKRSIV